MSKHELDNSINISEIGYEIRDYYDWYNKVLTYPGFFFRGRADITTMSINEMNGNKLNAYDRTLIRDMKTTVDKNRPQVFGAAEQKPQRTIPGSDFVSDDMTPEQIEMLFSNKAL